MVVAVRMDTEIDKKLLFRYLGYKADVEPSARIAALLEEYVGKAEEIIEPAYSYVIHDIEAVEGSRVLVEGAVLFQSNAIAHLLSKCEKVAVFVLTIGSRLGETAGWLADMNMIVESYVMDAIGSTMVDKLGGLVHREIQEEAELVGLCASHRFSPGHCDWDISGQRMVFRALKGRSSGVALTEDSLMVPQKSVSGIVGLGDSGRGIEDYSPCRTCTKRACAWRRRD